MKNILLRILLLTVVISLSSTLSAEAINDSTITNNWVKVARSDSTDKYSQSSSFSYDSICFIDNSEHSITPLSSLKLNMQAYDVGSPKGEFNVNNSGAAVYSIGIETPMEETLPHL